MGNEIVQISFDSLRQHPMNIRHDYGDLRELTASISAKGIQNPLLVVPDPDEEGAYLVVAGNRRLLAGRKSDRTEAPCIVSDMTEQEQAEAMLIENLQRKNLTVPEEAQAFQMCLTDFGMDVKDLSAKTGFSKRTIRRRANVAKLDQKLLKRRLKEPDMQISFTMLAQLEHVKDVGIRNRILEAATDGKDFSCKVEQAVTEQKRDSVIRKMKSLAEKAGITDAPEDAHANPYSGKWITVKQFPIRDGVPEEILSEEEAGQYAEGGLHYLVWYSNFRIIKAAAAAEPEESQETASETEGTDNETAEETADETDKAADATESGISESATETESGKSGSTDDGNDENSAAAPALPAGPTPEELYFLKVDENRLLMTDLSAAMHDEMSDFFIGILGGKFGEPEDADALLKKAWNLLLRLEATADDYSIKSGIMGQSSYGLPEAAEDDLRARIADMPVALQMLAVAFWNCSEMQLADESGFHDGDSAQTMEMLRDCIGLYGFSFSNDEYIQMLDGTHPLYTENWDREESGAEESPAALPAPDDTEDDGDALDEAA